MLVWTLRVIALAWCLLFPPGCGSGWVGVEEGPDAGEPQPDGVPWTEVEITVCADGGATYATIAEAIAGAPDASTIKVCAGTYPEHLVIDRTVRIVGAGAATTILDAGGAGTAVVVAGGPTAALEGFTIRGGASSAVTCVDAAIELRAVVVTASTTETGGGALYAERCAGVIEDATFAGNTAYEGGALYLRDGSVDVRASSFSNNRAWRGGAIYQASDALIEGSTIADNDADWTGGAIYVERHAPVFRGTVIQGNAAAWEGGGMYLHQSSARIEDCTITANTSEDDGGGLRLFESTARLERNVISANRAIEGDGGGIKSSHLATVFVDNQLVDNEAYGAGGGIELDNDSSQWNGGVIRGNRASIGGGVHAMRWPWHDGVIENVRIVDNSAWRGGGIYLEDHFQLVTIRGVLVQDNHANQAAGVYVRGTPLRMSGSVIVANRADDAGGGFYTAPSSDHPWTEPCPCPPVDPAAEIAFVVVHGNTADAAAAVWNRAPNVTFESSIFSGHTGNAVTAAPGRAPAWRYNDTFPATFAGMLDPTGSSGNLAVDPGFLASGDYHLAPTSACRDAGDPADTDPDGTRADMGAYAGPTPMP